MSSQRALESDFEILHLRLKHVATSRKVAGSGPDEVNDFFFPFT
jgi:hypothetical protein